MIGLQPSRARSEGASRTVRSYRWLRGFLRLAVRVFFRRFEVVDLEHIPPEGAVGVVFCGNHPNSLLDPVLITAATDRVVRFAAKDVLFRSRVLAPLLHAMGAVPIRRRRDHGGTPVSNEAAFEALERVLIEGGAMGIFPEGLSHDGAELERLKTGAARMSLRAKDRAPARRIAIVPTGLNYLRRNRFRSCALVQFGEPIEIDAHWLEAFRADERKAVRELTALIEQRLRALTINAPDWETIRVLDEVRRLYEPPRIPLEQRVELARRFNRYYPRLRDQPEIAALFRDVRAYLRERAALGVRDDMLARDPAAWELVLHAARYLVLLLVWLPLALPGAAIHVPLLLALALLGERIAPRKDVIATTKFVAGVACVLAAWLLSALAIGWWRGWPWGALALVLLPLSGYATLQVLRRLESLRHVGRTLLQMLTLRRELARLRRRRLALQQRIIEAVHRHKPADLELLFPTPPPDSEEEWTL